MDLFLIAFSCVTGLLATALLFWSLDLLLWRKQVGPLRLPLIGHLYLLTDLNLHLVFTRLAQKHGDVIQLHLLGQSWVVVSSLETAKKTTAGNRAVVYGSRPYSKFTRTFQWKDGIEDIAFAPNNERWRRYRKLIHPLLSPTAVKDYDHILMSEVSKMVQHLKQQSSDSVDPREAVRLFPFNSMSTALFGVSRDSTDPIFIELVAILNAGMDAAQFGQVADLAPFLMKLPLPYWNYIRSVTNRQYAWVRREIQSVRDQLRSPDLSVAQRASASFLGKLQLEMERDPSVLVEDAAMILILMDLVFAGVDTSASVVTFFFSFMANHPHVLKRIQEELHTLLKGAPPTLNDYGTLPYTEAVIYEMLRLRPAAPLGIPHCTTEDDVLDGVFVPKDSTVWYNIWHIHRHPDLWSEPVEAFDPNRFLRFAEKSQQEGSREKAILKDDPANLVHFGFGRRYCPGMHLARREMFLAVTSLAYHFDIEKPAGVGWVKDTGDLGLSLKHHPFKVVLRPRDGAQ